MSIIVQQTTTAPTYDWLLTQVDLGATVPRSAPDSVAYFNGSKVLTTGSALTFDGSTFVGLIAHEAQEASRTQVATGVKDGPEMQAMDYSNAELIACMIAELKSLRALVAQLEQGN